MATALRLLLPLTLLLLSTLVLAGRIDNGQCPMTSDSIVFSPFKPYWHFMPGSRQHCWNVADCLFEYAEETRKQQFAATALVMGLIPLTLKDIAWPEKRLVHLTEVLNPIVEILVLALGLLPVYTNNKGLTTEFSAEVNLVYRRTGDQSRIYVVLYMVLSAIGLLGALTGLALLEIWSKGNALGCPFPVFVLVWYLIALVPATIHCGFATLRRHRQMKHPEQQEKEARALLEDEAAERARAKPKIVTAIQGADEDWPVQLSWGVYYIAGTLVFTSVMAVTVAELVVWVGLAIGTAGCSKLLGFFICLWFEKGKGKGSASLLGKDEVAEVTHVTTK